MYSLPMQDVMMAGEAVSGEGALPLLRNRENGRMEPCDWGLALALFRERMRALQAVGGARATGWLASGGLLNEELAFCTELATEGFGFGVGGAERGAPPSETEWPLPCRAPEESDVVVFCGNEASSPQSPYWERLGANARQPRVMGIAEEACVAPHGEAEFLKPRKGTMATLVHGIGNIMVASGWTAEEFLAQRTTGLSEYKTFAATFTTDRVSAETGIDGEAIWEFAQALGTRKRVAFCGVPGKGDRRITGGIANLALLTGSFGRVGAGMCFGCEPANARGAEVFGGPGSISDVEAAVATGELKGLWVIATDGFQSAEMQRRLAAIATGVEFLVVQGAARREPWMARASLLLPATGWRGKEGTLLSPGGQLHLRKPDAHGSGVEPTDFRLFQLLAQYWECGRQFARWASPEAAFRLLQESPQGGLVDFQGRRDYGEIDAGGRERGLGEEITDSGVLTRWDFSMI